MIRLAWCLMPKCTSLLSRQPCSSCHLHVNIYILISDLYRWLTVCLVIRTWEYQLKRHKNPFPHSYIYIANLASHVKPGAITSYTYHGNLKRKATLDGSFDVVITTYKTLATQWEKSQTADYHSNSKTGSLFSVLWHRVILDEGKHMAYILIHG